MNVEVGQRKNSWDHFPIHHFFSSPNSCLLFDSYPLDPFPHPLDRRWREAARIWAPSRSRENCWSHRLVGRAHVPHQGWQYCSYLKPHEDRLNPGITKFVLVILIPGGGYHMATRVMIMMFCSGREVMKQTLCQPRRPTLAFLRLSSRWYEY